MRLTGKGTLPLIALLSVSSALWAEGPNKVFINPSVGFQVFDHDRDFSETATFQLGLEYRFHDHWAAEAVYGNADPDRKYSPGYSDYKDYRLDGLYYFTPVEEAFQPYLAAGAGHTEFDNDPEARMNVGGGLRYRVNELVSLRGDVREFWGMDEDKFDSLVSLGISFAFGPENTSEPQPEPAPMPAAPKDSDNDGVNDANDQCPGTPGGAPVDSKGCIQDADGDGVYDEADQCPQTPAGAKVDAKGCEVDSDGDGVADSRDTCPNTRANAPVDERGCERKAPEQRVMELNIQFPTNSSEIRSQYNAEIQRVADIMKQYPEVTVEIAGHSDNTGDADYNQWLSQRRAEAVRQRLIERFDIAPKRVSATGYGESEPVASNDTAAGRAENRRVEARIEYTVENP
ncbi:OmpA family protein [Marinobacteraceae bacterium S3BR75-40.1]